MGAAGKLGAGTGDSRPANGLGPCKGEPRAGDGTKSASELGPCKSGPRAGDGARTPSELGTGEPRVLRGFGPGAGPLLFGLVADRSPVVGEAAGVLAVPPIPGLGAAAFGLSAGVALDAFPANKWALSLHDLHSDRFIASSSGFSTRLSLDPIAVNTESCNPCQLCTDRIYLRESLCHKKAFLFWSTGAARS